MTSEQVKKKRLSLEIAETLKCLQDQIDKLDIIAERDRDILDLIENFQGLIVESGYNFNFSDCSLNIVKSNDIRTRKSIY